MLVFGLDLSLHAGFALFQENELICYGLVETGSPSKTEEFPWNYINCIKKQCSAVFNKINELKPDVVIIEALNRGKNRWSQYLLASLHTGLLLQLQNKYPVKYVDTSAWRKTLGLKLTKEQRSANKLSKSKKKELGIKGKTTPKHLAVKFINDKFHKSFKQKDNDICEAIALTQAYLLGCPISTLNN